MALMTKCTLSYMVYMLANMNLQKQKRAQINDKSATNAQSFNENSLV